MSDWWQCPKCARTFITDDVVRKTVHFGDYDGVRVCGDCFRVLCNQASPEELRRHDNIVDQIREANRRISEERSKKIEENDFNSALAELKFRSRPFLCLFNFLPFPMIVYVVLFFVGLLKLHIPFLIALVVPVIFSLILFGGEYYSARLLSWKPDEVLHTTCIYLGKQKWSPQKLRKDYRLYIFISLVVFVLGMAVSFGVSTLRATASDEQAVEAPADAETAQEAASN